MPGLLDFLFSQGGQGGGLLGGMGQQGGMQMGPDGMPMQINPGAQQQGLNVPNPMMPQQPQPGMSPQGMAGSLDPAFFANQVRQTQPGGGLLFDANSGLMGGMRGALNQISDPQGMRQQHAIQNYLAVKAAEEKPQYQVIEDPNTGIKRLVAIQPFGKGVTYVNPNEPSGSAPPQPPPGMVPGGDVKTHREGIAKAAVANQEDAVKSAKAAADIQPLLDEMHAAYEDAHKLGATGPVAASTIGRYGATGMAALGDATGLGSLSKPLEAARQRYDIAKAAVQARITAAQNKGEGQVSNYERQLYGAQFPDLTAIDPETQIKNLRQIRDQNRQTLEAGKIPALGQAPQVGAVLNRPSVSGADTGVPASPAGSAIAPPSAPVKVTSQAQYNLLPSGSPYIAPDGSPRTKR
jgi:hypothetical protein